MVRSNMRALPVRGQFHPESIMPLGQMPDAMIEMCCRHMALRKKRGSGMTQILKSQSFHRPHCWPAWRSGFGRYCPGPGAQTDARALIQAGNWSRQLLQMPWRARPTPARIRKPRLSGPDRQFPDVGMGRWVRKAFADGSDLLAAIPTCRNSVRHGPDQCYDTALTSPQDRPSCSNRIGVARTHSPNRLAG